MAGKTVKKWITIDGRHIPIFEDGSMGGAATKFGERAGNKGTTGDLEPEMALRSTWDADKRIRERFQDRKTDAIKYIAETEDVSEDVAKDIYEHMSVSEKKHIANEAYKNNQDKDNKKIETGQEGGLSDEEMKKYIIDAPIKDDPDYNKKRVERELADENDAYDREHQEGNYRESAEVIDRKESDDISKKDTMTSSENNKTKYQPLNDEEREVLNKYFDSPEGKWAKNIANEQLKNGEDWDKVTRQAYGVASKYVKPRDTDLEEAYKKGSVAPEVLKSKGYTDEDLAALSKSGRDDALKRVEEGRNKSTYIDPMGNLNQRKTKSDYEKNYGEDFRDMSKSQARKERIGDIEVSDSTRAQFSDKSDEELLTTSRNAYKHKFSREESQALNDELKSRGYDYIQGGWKKNRSSEKSIKVGDKEVSVSPSPMARAHSMTESELRAYVRNHGLTKQYNTMMNLRSGAAGYSKQIQVLRDLVADDIAVEEARRRKKK